MIYEVKLPLPQTQLSPNFRGHTFQRRKYVKQYREACAMFYRAAKIPRLLEKATSPKEQITPITIHLDFYLAKRKDASGKVIKDNCYRPLDEANANGSAKPAIDALIDAGVIPDDSYRYVRIGETNLHRNAKAHGGKTMVVLTIDTNTD